MKTLEHQPQEMVRHEGFYGVVGREREELVGPLPNPPQLPAGEGAERPGGSERA
jgi:hypothetical protein